MDLFDSVGLPRIHHQLLPNKIRIEPGFDSRIAEGLIKLGHQVCFIQNNLSNNRIDFFFYVIFQIYDLDAEIVFSGVQSIYRHPNGTVDAASDPRKAGLAAAY